MNPLSRATLTRRSLFVFFGKVAPIVVLFIIGIVYSRRLSYADYGIFQSVWMYSNILSVFIGFGITSIILSTNLSYLFTFLSQHKKRVILFYALLVLLSFTVFYFYDRTFSSITRYIVILFILFQLIAGIAETLLIKTHNEKSAFVINSIYSFLFFGWHLFVIRNYNLDHLILGVTILSVLKTIAMAAVPYKIQPLEEKPTSDNVFTKHWVYLGLNDITGTLSKWIDKILLVYLLTSREFAVYFNGSFEIPLVGLLVSVAGSLLLVNISDSKKSVAAVALSFNNSFKILAAFVFPLFFFLLFYRHDLFGVLFKNKYDESIPVFLITIMILPLRINNYGALLQCYSKGNIIMAGSILDICLALVLMVILYPFYGTIGVAIAVVVATYCQAGFYLWQSARIMRIRIIELLPLLHLVILLAVLFLLYSCIYYGFSPLTLWARLIIAALVTIVSCLAGLLYFYKNTTTD